MRILEEFWYGNIEPTEYNTSSCTEYKKLQELICRNEEKLRATMTDQQKELFEKYTDSMTMLKMAVRVIRRTRMAAMLLPTSGKRFSRKTV